MGTMTRTGKYHFTMDKKFDETWAVGKLVKVDEYLVLQLENSAEIKHVLVIGPIFYFFWDKAVFLHHHLIK